MVDQIKLDSPIGTSTGPALATLVTVSGSDWLAWKGAGNDSGLYYSRIAYQNGNLHTYGLQTQVAGVASACGPALTAFGSDVYMAWKGEGDDQRIWVANGPESPAEFGLIAWSPQRLGPAGAKTNQAPALAATSNLLHLVWKDAGEVDLMWSTSSDGKQWSGPTVINQAGGSSDTPALAAIGGVVYLAWKAEPGDDRIFWSMCTDGANWQNQSLVNGVGGTSTGPALGGDAAGNLWLAWKEEPGGTRIFRAMLSSPQSNTNWTSQQCALGLATDDRPALATNSNGMAWKGVGSDTSIYMGLLDVISPPFPAAPIDLYPTEADFTNPVTMRWKDPLAGKLGASQYFEFAVFVNDVLYPYNTTGPYATAQGGPPDSGPFTIPNGSIKWDVRGVNNAGNGPWASASFSNNLGPTITVQRIGNTNEFDVSGSGFTAGGAIALDVNTAIAGGTPPIDATLTATAQGNLATVKVNCGSMCSSAGGGQILFLATDQSSNTVSNTVTESCS